MPSNLAVVAEREIPEAPVQIEQPKMEKPLQRLYESSQGPETLALLMEIRKVLNAKASAVLALVAASLLTGAAMWLETWMALGISISFDVLIAIPIFLIAYKGGNHGNSTSGV